MNRRILGVDVGGVIIDRVRNDGTDTAFKGERYLETAAVPDAFSSLSKLMEIFDGIVYVVSKCGLETELKTRDWLKEKRFYDLTKISPANVHYCRTRQEKSPICKWLGITHFIDDRLEVLNFLETVSNKYLFGPQNQKELEQTKNSQSITLVNSWKAVLEKINQE